MIQTLTNLIEQLKKVADETGLKVSDECLFIQSCTFLRTPNYNQSVKSESFLPKKEETSNKPNSEPVKSPIIPPTDKQIYFLKKNHWEGELPKTKKEASIIINSYITNTQKENI